MIVHPALGPSQDNVLSCLETRQANVCHDPSSGTATAFMLQASTLKFNWPGSVAGYPCMDEHFQAGLSALPGHLSSLIHQLLQVAAHAGRRRSSLQGHQSGRGSRTRPLAASAIARSNCQQCSYNLVVTKMVCIEYGGAATRRCMQRSSACGTYRIRCMHSWTLCARMRAVGVSEIQRWAAWCARVPGTVAIGSVGPRLCNCMQLNSMLR